MAYENDMQIVYDAVTKSAVVIFRDVLSILGPFQSARSAYDAGEQHCRDNGWDDSLDPDAPTTPFGAIVDI
ncbi:MULTISPECIES: hypothetical protein [unclassified Rhizobium]|uniref:hypothetical protein n=1 Tax=unclassified Rhizobium TaxID=2613769 RepID=UPI001ADCCA1D|nr:MULTISPECIES: hypothetical protein [unclassified Rhizobium]MBO9102173.1 hypothetical protein [Rhizobium sp. L58/93]MBO9171896.1 hypothetical protein [Rhizobium sp. L245/93]MBO9186446.1 hypothetical protein [Rhizobium sp. E27B/91]QXZ87200.1 hypothetical protein J5287_21800 [Rhizobium sp. K1/93]QXZ92767.1 hypothetical protein J5280_19095 [Rhizobium sp. K15/93]